MADSKPLDIVDENDVIIGKINDDEIQLKKGIVRSSAILLFNSKGELFLQKRASNKSRYPLYWDFSAAGFVDSGETYDVAAARELKEELGVAKTPSELEFVSKELIILDMKIWLSIYKLVYDGPIKIEKSEVDSGKFFSLDEIKQLAESGGKVVPVVISTLQSMNLLR